MDAQKRARLDFWIELAGVVVVGTLLIGALAYSKSKPLTADDIAIEAGDLRSLSAAGSLLAQEFSDGQVTDTFFEEQLELTKDKVDTARETLETSDIDEEVRSDAERVKQLGNRVGAAFARSVGNTKSS
jgi:hypothetical protein